MSYMNRKNILSEGLLDMILKAIFKKSTSKMQKKMMKDPKIRKSIDTLQKQLGGIKLYIQTLKRNSLNYRANIRN